MTPDGGPEVAGLAAAGGPPFTCCCWDIGTPPPGPMLALLGPGLGAPGPDMLGIFRFYINSIGAYPLNNEKTR